MQNAFSTLLGPILVLWLGALVFYVVDSFLEPQDAGIAETIVLALATGVLVLGRARVGVSFRFGRALVGAGWPGRAPFLRLDHTAWLLALIVLVLATTASLASLGGHIRGRAGRTATLGATLFVLSAGDWATLALVWVLVDVFLIYGLESSNEAAQGPRWAAFASLIGAVLLGLSVTLWQLSGGDIAQSPPWPVAGLALLAGLLRLLPWPLPSRYDRTGTGDNAGQETPLARVVTYVTPVLCSVYLWARLGLGSGTPEAEGWLTALSLWAGIALLVSALQAWSAREPEQLIDRVAPYGAALSLLAAGLGLPAQWQLLVGTSAILSACAVYVGWTQCQYLDLADPSSFWRAAPTGLAILSLTGLPFTMGFPARAALYDRIFADGRWVVLLLTMIGEAGMLGALLRVLLEVECTPFEPAPSGGFNLEIWRRNLGYGAGVALAAAIVILGVLPTLIGAPGLVSWFRLPRMYVWAALLLPAVGAIALYRSEETLMEWLDEWWPLLSRLLDLRWVWRGLEQVARALATAVWTASRVVEGAGYTAWVLLFCLIALLFLRTG